MEGFQKDPSEAKTNHTTQQIHLSLNSKSQRGKKEAKVKQKKKKVYDLLPLQIRSKTRSAPAKTMALSSSE